MLVNTNLIHFTMINFLRLTYKVCRSRHVGHMKWKIWLRLGQIVPLLLLFRVQTTLGPKSEPKWKSCQNIGSIPQVFNLSVLGIGGSTVSPKFSLSWTCFVYFSTNLSFGVHNSLVGIINYNISILTTLIFSHWIW